MSPDQPPRPEEPRDDRLDGLVIRKSRGYYFVLTGQGEILCRVSNRLRKALVYSTADASSTRRGVVAVRAIETVDPVAVGDRVRLVDGGGGTGRIDEVLPRRNRFSRLIRRGRPLEQTLAANIDRVYGVFAAALPDLRWDMLDRMTLQAELLGLPLTLVITKMDLADEEEMELLHTIYRPLGYDILEVCAPEGQGIDALRERLAGKTSVVVGESGVGKTSLLNAVQPGLGLRVGEIRNSRHGRGRHTTTMVEAVPLDGGGWLIDTPGINELGLFAPPGAPSVAECFPELRGLAGQCQFGADCTHTREPGCAVLAAVAEGRVDEGRHESFLAAQAELAAAPTPHGRKPAR